MIEFGKQNETRGKETKLAPKSCPAFYPQCDIKQRQSNPVAPPNSPGTWCKSKLHGRTWRARAGHCARAWECAVTGSPGNRVGLEASEDDGVSGLSSRLPAGRPGLESQCCSGSVSDGISFSMPLSALPTQAPLPCLPLRTKARSLQLCLGPRNTSAFITCGSCHSGRRPGQVGS